MPKIRYSWPFVITIIGLIAFWVEITNGILDSYLGNITVTEGIIGAESGPVSIVRPLSLWGDLQFVCLQLAMIIVILLGIYQIWLNRFRGDQRQALFTLAVIWILFILGNFAEHKGYPSFYPLCGLFSLGGAILYWRRHNRKLNIQRTQFSRLKLLSVVLLSTVILIQGTWMLYEWLVSTTPFYNSDFGLEVFFFFVHIIVPIAFLLNLLDHHACHKQEESTKHQNRLIEELGE
jgi:hypothetical protein